ncbi:MAG: hypothetical protein GEV10_24770 [Streptosporangiales bacterium]|nr:hypothetical protein [Streptosporangiales bacterium]
MLDVTEVEANKAIVTRLVDEVFNGLDLIDELYARNLTRSARAWIRPFRESFPDGHMEIINLIAEGDKVVGHFACTGTHTRPWLGHPPTGRRFTRIPEVYIFTIKEQKIVHAWGLEDTHRRLVQLGLTPR